MAVQISSFLCYISFLGFDAFRYFWQNIYTKTFWFSY